MEPLSSLDPMTWMILASAGIISVCVLFAKAIKVALKGAVIVVMLILALYFLRQAGVL